MGITPKRRRAGPHDVAAEIIRRATPADGDCSQTGYVLRLSRPPTMQEQLQLMAARLQRRPIVIMTHKCATVDQWRQRYGSLKDRSAQR